jgi:hypothetical protein
MRNAQHQDRVGDHKHDQQQERDVWLKHETRSRALVKFFT